MQYLGLKLLSISQPTNRVYEFQLKRFFRFQSPEFTKFTASTKASKVQYKRIEPNFYYHFYLFQSTVVRIHGSSIKKTEQAKNQRVFSESVNLCTVINEVAIHTFLEN